MHETNTYAKWDAHDDMAKCDTQENDMETTMNNWHTPGASNTGRYRIVGDDDGDDFPFLEGSFPSRTAPPEP